jgi:hypothetical protein
MPVSGCDIVLYAVFFIVEQRTSRYWIPVTLYSMMCFYCRTREQEILDAYSTISQPDTGIQYLLVPGSTIKT